MPATSAAAGALWVPLLLLMVAAGALFARAGGSRAGLDRWARTNGYRIVKAERRYLERGAFPERVPRGLGVFEVTVEDGRGNVRHGYVRCSIGVLGLFADEATVRWDDEP